jgi:NADPH:quinone reductase-like Zn-dependent oxidoreductase
MAAIGQNNLDAQLNELLEQGEMSIPIVDLIFRGLSVHGYWLNRSLDSTPKETIVRTYRQLADLVRNGTLAAPVEATYALADYREAIGHSARNDRHRKVLFTFQ